MKILGPLLLLSCVLTVIAIHATPATSGERASEPRVIFDEDFHWITQEGAERTLQRIKQAGFNIFVPCVWHGRGTTWPSAINVREPAWEKKYTPNHDPLGYLVRRAHELGIEVHPWFTVTLRQRDFLGQFSGAGVPEKHFDIHNAAFREFIVNLMLEVVTRYDIDGINLDYVRTGGICDSLSCIEDYRKRFGRALQVDKAIHEYQPRARGALEKWNGDAVSDVVRRFSARAKELKPNLLISADTVVEAPDWKVQGADGVLWANSQWVDVVYHMDYRKSPYFDHIQKARTLFHRPDALLVLVGNYDESNSDEQRVVSPRASDVVVGLIERSRGLLPYGAGVALYEYRFLTDDQIRALRQSVFRTDTSATWAR